MARWPKRGMLPPVFNRVRDRHGHHIVRIKKKRNRGGGSKVPLWIANAPTPFPFRLQYPKLCAFIKRHPALYKIYSFFYWKLLEKYIYWKILKRRIKNEETI